MISTLKFQLSLLVCLCLIWSIKGQFQSGNTTFEGVTIDNVPSFYTLSGSNGIKVPLTNRLTSQNQGYDINYFIRMWLRPYNQFNLNSTKTPEVFLEINRSMSCKYQYNNTIICSKFNASSNNYSDQQQQSQMQISTGQMANVINNMWMHVTISGSKGQDISYIQVDYQYQSIGFGQRNYLSLSQNSASQWFAFLGSNTLQTNGYKGDLREFYFTQDYVNPSQVQIIMNQYLSWDLKNIGYYRLLDGNLQDLFRSNMTGSLIPSKLNNQVPQVGYDSRPNDICFQQANRVMLLRVDNLTANYAQIDSRMKTLSTNVQYSASFWLRTKPGITFNTKYSKALSIFELEGVFSLWFTSNSTLKILINGGTDKTNKQSQDIFIPMDQWVNVQVVINSIYGYDVRVYDLVRRQILSISEKMTLTQQYPTARFKLIDNFKGYIEEVMVYQAVKDLPMPSSVGEQSQITDNSLIIFYKLNKNNFQDRNIYSLGKTTRNIFGPQVQIPGATTFEAVDWDDTIAYQDPRNLGSLNQTVSFFDGLSCNTTYTSSSQSQQSDQTTQLSNTPVFALTGSLSNIRYAMSSMKDNIQQACVEFWFKRDQGPMSSLNYLFSLYSASQKKHFFQIYQDVTNDQSIVCDIFSDSTNTITYQLSDPTNQNVQWSHLVCQFQNKFKINGIYTTAYNISQIFEEEIFSQSNLYLKSGQYDLIIGNNNDLDYGQDSMLIKEVRFWLDYREFSQINQYLYAQVDPYKQTKLVGYYRLNRGITNFTNYPNLDQQKVTYYSLSLAKSQIPPLNCPLNTFPQQNMICQRSPYNSFKINILANYDNTSNTLSWTLTSQYSDMVNDAFTSSMNFSYVWSSYNQTLGNYLVLQGMNSISTNNAVVGSNNFIINQNFLQSYTENSKLQIQLQSYNYLNTFIVSSVFNFQLNLCRYLYDTNTYQSNTTLYYEIWQQGSNHILQTFWQNLASNCQSSTAATDLIQYKTELAIYPSYLNLTETTVRYDYALKLFMLNITKQDQMLIPSYQYVTFVVTVYWAQGGVKIQETGLSIVYRLKFMDLTQQTPNIYKKEVLTGNDLFINATNDIFDPYIQIQFEADSSTVNQTVILQNYDFLWTCPQIFQSVCESQKNQLWITITNDDFNNFYGQLFITYTFNLTVIPIYDPYGDSNIFYMYQVTFVSSDKPFFTLGVQDKNKIYIAEDNTIAIDLFNYSPQAENIIIDWKILPSINSQLLTFSNSSAQVTVARGGFQSQTTYNFTVKITNTFKDNLQSTQSLVITTGYGNLLQGKALVDPMTGMENVTNFTFSMNNWFSDYIPIQYDLYAVLADKTQYKLNPQKLSIQNTYSTFLPLLSYINAVVYDSIGNVIYQSVQVAVQANTTEPMDADTWNLTFYFDAMDAWAIQQYNYNYQATLMNKAILEQKLLILFNMSVLTNTIQLNVNDTESYYNRVLVNRTMRILYFIMNNTFQMNHTIATLTMDIYQQIGLKTLALAGIINNTQYAQTQANVLSCIQKYATEKLSFLYREVRLLYLNTMNFNDLRNLIQTINLEKLKFQILICKKMTSYETQTMISTYSFKTIIEKVSKKSTTQSRGYSFPGDAYSTVQIGDVISYANQKYPDSASYCVFSNLYYVYPVSGYSFTYQASNFPIYFLFELYDDQGNQLLNPSNDIITPSNSANSMLVTQYQYNFSSSTYAFKNNQTVCMQIIANQYAYSSSQKWQSNNCITQYQPSLSQITCKCQNLQYNYSSIVTDYTRILIDGQVSDGVAFQSEVTYEIQARTIVLIIFLILLFIAIYAGAVLLDVREESMIEKDQFKVNADLVQQISITYQTPISIIKYRSKQLSRFQNVNNLSKVTILKMIFFDLHPLTSIWTKHDVLMRRLLRASILILQIFILTFVCLIITYATHLHNKGSYDSDQITSEQSSYSLLTGFLLSIFLLPLPLVFTNFLKKEFKINKKPLNINKEDNEAQGKQQIQEEENNKLKKFDKKFNMHKGENGNDQQHEGGESEDQRSESLKNESLQSDSLKTSNLESQGRSLYQNSEDGSREIKFLRKATQKILLGPDPDDMENHTQTDGNSASDQKDEFSQIVEEIAHDQPHNNNKNNKQKVFRSKTQAIDQAQKENSANPNMFSDITVIDRTLRLKLPIFISSCICSVALLVAIGLMCNNMSTSYQQVFVDSVFFMYFFGWVIFNPIRILLIAFYLLRLVQYQKLKLKKKDKVLEHGCEKNDAGHAGCEGIHEVEIQIQIRFLIGC